MPDRKNSGLPKAGTPKRSVCPLLESEWLQSSDAIPIEKNGDVVIQVQDPAKDINLKLRCSSKQLRTASPYFDVLLDPGKFSTGIQLDQQLKTLSVGPRSNRLLPVEELPLVLVKDAGDLPAADVHNTLALVIMFEALHGQNTTYLKTFETDRIHDSLILAIVSIVADHFDAAQVISKHIRSSHTLQKRLDRRPENFIESYTRRMILAGLLLDEDVWVKTHSADLVCWGSKSWRAEYNSSIPGSHVEDEGQMSMQDQLWWRLPQDVEDELQYRHERVLETIASLQMHFIALYTSKATQCKMFYGDSPQCDSFQLGEMTKFFLRKGLLDVSASYSAPIDLPEPADNALAILNRLHECPSYQIDQNHGRCGLRTRLLVPLARLCPRTQTGLCLRCWRHQREVESWLQKPVAKSWTFTLQIPLRWDHCRDHHVLKQMYTADIRDWTPKPT